MFILFYYKEMVFVDVHCHLDLEVFDSDRNEIVNALKEKNIFSLTNTLNPKNYEETKKLFLGVEHIKVCPGLYPQDAEEISDEAFNNYLDLIRKEQDSIVAIGEVGLDRHHTKNPELWEIQEKRFRSLIELAIEIDKPMLIHTRKAEGEVIEILKEYVEKYNFKRFDLHCFMGKKKYLKDIKEMGIYLSIPLSVLKAEIFQNFVKELPMRQLLVETDSPYLNPFQERNTPLNVPLIYGKIAEIKGYDLNEINNIIYRNYQRFAF